MTLAKEEPVASYYHEGRNPQGRYARHPSQRATKGPEHHRYRNIHYLALGKFGNTRTKVAPKEEPSFRDHPLLS